MKNIASEISEYFIPNQALLFFQSRNRKDQEAYVELYDIGRNGEPFNGRPLSDIESGKLAALLQRSTQNQHNIFQAGEIFDSNLLYLNPNKGYAVWQTPPGKETLLFCDQLGIPDGRANMPSMLWKASIDELYIYALRTGQRATEITPLYKAPFFNIYDDNRVCTGTVEIDFSDVCNLEEFIKTWQYNFFHSYFSHMIGDRSPVRKNIIQLWKSLVGTDKKFPVKELIKCGITLKDILK